MASTTIHNFASDGISIARGLASVADGDSVNTGLPSVNGFVARALDADTVINFTSASGRNATVSVYAAGIASGGTKTIYWEAWSNKKV